MDHKLFFQIREIIIDSYDESCIIEDISRELNINEKDATLLYEHYQKKDKERNEEIFNQDDSKNNEKKNIRFLKLLSPFIFIYSLVPKIFRMNKFLLWGYLVLVFGSFYIFIYGSIPITDTKSASYQHLAAISLGFILIAEFNLISLRKSLETKRQEDEYINMLERMQVLLQPNINKKEMHYSINKIIKNSKEFGVYSPSSSTIYLYEKLKSKEDFLIKVGIIITTVIWGWGEFL